MEEQDFVYLGKVRDYFRTINGKKVHVKAHEQKDDRMVSDAAAQRTAEWFDKFGRHDIARDREANALGVRAHQRNGGQAQDIAAGVPVHIRETAEDMSDDAITAAMFKIDEDNISPLERAIMAEFRKRGLKINARLSNVSLTNMSFDSWWLR